MLDGTDEPVDHVKDVTPERVARGVGKRVILGVVLIALSLGGFLMCRNRIDDRPLSPEPPTAPERR